MEKERIKYESPWTSQRKVVVETYMEPISFTVTPNKKNLEPLKVVDNIDNSEWELPSSSKRDFDYTWD